MIAAGSEEFPHRDQVQTNNIPRNGYTNEPRRDTRQHRANCIYFYGPVNFDSLELVSRLARRSRIYIVEAATRDV